MESLESHVSNPWLVMGDFNAVLRSEDTKGGNQVQDTEVKDFEIMLINTRLNELRFIGRFFTWTNSHVHSKIDRAIVNHLWLTKWPQ